MRRMAALAALLPIAVPLRAAEPPRAAAPAVVATVSAPVVTLLLDEAAARHAIAAQLVLLGRDPDAALDAARRLTTADLEVLVANPGMMQVAAGAESVWIAVIVGSLIIAGAIAVAASSDGAVIMIGG